MRRGVSIYPSCFPLEDVSLCLASSRSSRETIESFPFWLLSLIHWDQRRSPLVIGNADSPLRLFRMLDIKNLSLLFGNLPDKDHLGKPYP